MNAERRAYLKPGAAGFAGGHFLREGCRLGAAFKHIAGVAQFREHDEFGAGVMRLPDEPQGLFDIGFGFAYARLHLDDRDAKIGFTCAICHFAVLLSCGSASPAYCAIIAQIRTMSPNAVGDQCGPTSDIQASVRPFPKLPVTSRWMAALVFGQARQDFDILALLYHDFIGAEQHRPFAIESLEDRDACCLWQSSG